MPGRRGRRPTPAGAGLPPPPGVGHHDRKPADPGPRPVAQPGHRQVAGRVPGEAVRLTPAEVAATAEWIARWQLDSGMIPWFPGGHADPWNHVEATMALVVAGRRAEAERALGWLAATQHHDGTWCRY